MSLSIDKRLYTLESVDKLFNEYCMIVESRNGVPFYYAKQLFTDKHFKHLEAGKDWNGYYMYGDFGHYVTIYGFRKLATFYNFDVIQSLVEREK